MKKKKYFDAKICCNCKTMKGIKSYYVVPLENGGSDMSSNIITLCYKCYVNSIFNINEAKGKEKINYEGAEAILKDYIECNIGKKEAFELLGISCNNHKAFRTAINKYKKEHNIIAYKNNIDIIMSAKNPDLSDERVLGYVIFEDGTRINFTRDGVSIE